MARNLSASVRREIKARKKEHRHGRFGVISALEHYQTEEFNRRELEREKLWLAERIGAVRSFATEVPVISLMVAIQGYINWYLISGHPVEMSRHTQIGRTMTAIVMEQANR